MIDQVTFTREWLDEIRQQREYQKTDPALLEKMMLAYQIVELLISHQFKFIFKGGTSLGLLFGKPPRISIDVDIIMDQNEELDKYQLESLINDTVFHKVEEHERRNTGLPKRHFRFYYQNFMQKEDYILLDVLFSENPYHSLVKKPVDSPLLITREPYQLISLPSIDCITGDKLTAFAPDTTGVPYNKGKGLEIIKQIFDVGFLYDHIKNWEHVEATYRKIARQQISFRKLELDAEGPLWDTIQNSLLFSNRRPSDKGLEDKYDELSEGLGSFNSYRLGNKFHKEPAIEAVAKASLVAARLLRKSYSELQEYDPSDWKLYEIVDPRYNYLNKLRKQPTKALYYWFHTFGILGDHSELF